MEGWCCIPSCTQTRIFPQNPEGQIRDVCVCSRWVSFRFAFFFSGQETPVLLFNSQTKLTPSTFCDWICVHPLVIFTHFAFLTLDRRIGKRRCYGSWIDDSINIILLIHCCGAHSLRELWGFFGVAEPRHTSCHLPAALRAPQSFMSARLVMRADRKRWDSPISPPTHTEGDSLSGDKATGCTFLRHHARTLACSCVRMRTADYHAPIPQRHLLISRNFSWHFSYSSAEVTVSLSVILHMPSSFCFYLLSCHPFCRLFLSFLLHPSKLAHPSVNSVNAGLPSYLLFPCDPAVTGDSTIKSLLISLYWNHFHRKHL